MAKRWIQKATASIKRRGTEGKCTPITKPGCTGRARALALTFKKMARKRKKHEDGGIVDNEGFYNEFADGGTLDIFGGALSGATSGSSLGPVGMIGGGLMGLVGGIANMNAKQEQEELLKKQQLLQNRAINNQNFLQSLPQQQQYLPTFPEGGVITPSIRKYKDTSSIQPYIDPFTNKKFYPILGSTANIKRPDVFPIDIDDNGRSIMYGTYTEPYTKGGPSDSDYTRTTFRKFSDDNTTKVFYPNANLMRLNEGGGNPYKDRNRLENYSLLDNPDINPLYNKDMSAELPVRTQKGYIYANGGTVSANSELEKGEPFRTPNGQIYQVSNNAPTHQQGGVQMNLPNGTEILGKITDPETDEQFKQLGQKLKKAQDRYNKVLDSNPTPLAKKTAKMMLDKIQGRYDQLMQKQEMMKPSQSTDMYPDGGITGVKGATDWRVQDPLYTAQPQQQFNTTNDTDIATNVGTIAQQPNIDRNPWNTVQDTVGTIGQYAPIAYNLAEGIWGKPDTLKSTDYYNPYSSEVKNLMSGRRYNISPELEANRQAMRSYFQALQQGAPTQSRYLAGLQSGQISRQRADAEAYARKQNIDNQYRTEQAQTLQGLGAQEAATNMQVEDINARRKASQRQYLPTALSQLQQAAFVGQQGRMMKQRDRERLAIAKELYKNYPFDLTKIFNQ